mmetsp:Transcript_29969/g.47929  ORF Transcript_29969/g.47929 Transcript_29969/m.47929 type:complete len:230 (+) Transcript_29969:405-1094(+)
MLRYGRFQCLLTFLFGFQIVFPFVFSYDFLGLSLGVPLGLSLGIWIGLILIFLLAFWGLRFLFGLGLGLGLGLGRLTLGFLGLKVDVGLVVLGLLKNTVGLNVFGLKVGVGLCDLGLKLDFGLGIPQGMFFRSFWIRLGYGGLVYFLAIRVQAWTFFCVTVLDNVVVSACVVLGRKLACTAGLLSLFGLIGLVADIVFFALSANIVGLSSDVGHVGFPSRRFVAGCKRI